MAWPFKKLADGVSQWQVERRNRAAKSHRAGRVLAERKAREVRERLDRQLWQFRNSMLGCSAVFATLFGAIYTAVHFLTPPGTADTQAPPVVAPFAATARDAPDTGPVQVKAYWRKDGRYVESHQRGRPSKK